MYIPPHFAETNLQKLHDIIEEYSFALLLSQSEGNITGSHLPFLLDRNPAPNGCLYGHLAQANSQWKELEGQRALAIFSGPHAYISPSWYEADAVVPTWNYVAVHVYGRIEVIEDSNLLLDVVDRLTRLHEATMTKPWSIDHNSTYTERMLKQIVGFRMMIDTIEGKWKLNQNHPHQRRQKVIQRLRERGDENALVMAEMMEEGQ